MATEVKKEITEDIAPMLNIEICDAGGGDANAVTDICKAINTIIEYSSAIRQFPRNINRAYHSDETGKLRYLIPITKYLPQLLLELNELKNVDVSFTLQSGKSEEIADTVIDQGKETIVASPDFQQSLESYGQQLSEDSMKALGYVVVKEGDAIVKKYADGRTELLKTITSTLLPKHITLD